MHAGEVPTTVEPKHPSQESELVAAFAAGQVKSAELKRVLLEGKHEALSNLAGIIRLMDPPTTLTREVPQRRTVMEVLWGAPRKPPVQERWTSEPALGYQIIQGAAGDPERRGLPKGSQTNDDESPMWVVATRQGLGIAERKPFDGGKNLYWKLAPLTNEAFGKLGVTPVQVETALQEVLRLARLELSGLANLKERIGVRFDRELAFPRAGFGHSWVMTRPGYAASAR
jgi:hypothetical protein